MIEATRIYKNGTIYTADKFRRLAQVLALADDKIIYVGDELGSQGFLGSDTEVVDLEGKLVLPSFFEGHAHFTKAASAIIGVNLAGMNTQEEYVEVCQKYLSENPETTMIRGQGYLEACFPGIGPSKEALDSVSTEIPIVLEAETLHSLWANSKAIELAGITKDTSDPKNGRIERDAEGNPNGCFRETAQSLILDSLPDYTVEQYQMGILAYQTMAHSLGFTGSYDPWLLANSTAIEAIKALDRAGKLSMYLRGAYWADPNKGVDQVPELVEARTRDNEGMDLFKINAIKFFEDGVLESLTGYLLEPYEIAEGRPKGWKGDNIWNPQNMRDVVAAVDREGFGIHVHCAGDGAVKQTLDSIEHAQNVNGKRDSRHCITHIFLVDPADVARFKKLDVVAMINSYWCQIDETYFVNGTYIGMERAQHTFPLGSFFRAGALVACASDYPITAVPNPFVGIEIGVTRIAPDNYHPWVFDYDDPKFHEPLWPEERAGIEEMIDSFTINQAYANFVEFESGSLEVGKSANLIIVDKDILSLPAEDIGTARVVQTVFRGKTVFCGE